ncbi:MAG: arylsulfatase [Verrucomicrobiota bacterium]|nr:arylsulfatase [Verrucomicrobiota bacterium]
MKQSIIALLIATTTFGSTTASAETLAKPNVVIIYGDDVGYGDLGVYGAEKIPTIHLDKLAENGLVFTDAHSATGTCTPSRYSMLTGRFAFRRDGTGILAGDGKLCIDTHVLTLPKLFQQAGYKTAVIGKWHLGLGKGSIDWNTQVKPGPAEVGFDYSFILPATGDRVPCVYMENQRILNLDPDDPITVSYKKPLAGYPNGHEHPELLIYPADKQHSDTIVNGVSRIGYMSGGKAALWDDEGMADELVARTKAFIAANKERPFFLYFAAHDIHVPRIPHPRFRGKSQSGLRGDAMVQLDWCAGEIVKTLEDAGLAKNTIVIFSSDNGPVYDDGYADGSTVKKSSASNDQGHYGAGPHRGGKYQIYEGGTRVPMIVSWPGHIKPGTSKALVSQLDFLSSFAALLGIDVPPAEAIDSQNALPALLGTDQQGNEYIIEQAAELALRHHGWKYIAPRIKKDWRPKVKPALFNLDVDIGETNNLIKMHPEQVEAMSAKLNQIIKTQLRVDVGRTVLH